MPEHLPKPLHEKPLKTEDASNGNTGRKEIPVKTELLALFQSAQNYEQNADTFFPAIEKLVHKHGWPTLIQTVLSSTSFQKELRNPDMAVSLLVESLEILGIPEIVSTENLESALETVSDSLSWIKLSSYIQKRKETEKGKLTNEHAMTRILANRNEVEFWDKKKTLEVASKILKTNPLARRRFIKDYCSVNDRYSPEEIRYWLKKDPDKILKEIPSAFSFNAVMNTPPFEATEYDKKLTFEDRDSSIEAILPEDQVRSFFCDAIQHYPPDAYFTEYHFVEESLRHNYFLDPYLDQIDLFPLMRRRCQTEWGEDEPTLTFIKGSSALPLAHNLLAIFNPLGRLSILLDTQETPPAQSFFKANSLLDFYTAQKCLTPDPHEDQIDADFETLVLFFHLLPPEFKKAAKDYFLTHNVDIEEIALKIKQNFGADVIESTPRKMRLLTPKQLGKDLRHIIETEIERRVQTLSAPVEINLESFVETLNHEHALPKKTFFSVQEAIESLNFDTARNLEQILGISLANISLRELFSLISFLKNSRGESGVRRLETFLNQTEEDDKKLHRIRSFLSLEQGGQEMGTKILAIADRYDPQTADTIFEKYATVVETAQHTEERVRTLLNNPKQASTASIAQNLLLRAQKTMAAFADHPEWSARAVERKLDSFSDELFLFAETFRHLKQEDTSFSLEDVRDTKVLLLEGGQIPDILFEQMHSLYEQNYTDAPAPFRQLLQEKLLARRDDPSTRFYVVTHGGRVAGFNTFTDKRDAANTEHPTERYFASFNVDPALAQSKIGDALMTASLDTESEHGPVSADCIPSAPITQTYINKKGFVGVGIRIVKGVPLLNIRKDADLSARLVRATDHVSQNLTPRQLSETDLFANGYALTQYTKNPEPENTFACTFTKI